MFKVFLKSGPSFLKSGPRWEKSLKIGKNACPNPRNSLLLPVEANFLSGVFSPLTSAETCEKK